MGQSSEESSEQYRTWQRRRTGQGTWVNDRANDEAEEKERLLVKVLREQKLVEQDGEKDAVKDVAKDEAESKERLWVNVLREQKLVVQDVAEDEELWGKVLKGQKLVVPDIERGEEGVRREEISWMQMVLHSTKLIRNRWWYETLFFNFIYPYSI